jgi:hypothetical protein
MKGIEMRSRMILLFVLGFVIQAQAAESKLKAVQGKAKQLQPKIKAKAEGASRALTQVKEQKNKLSAPAAQVPASVQAPQMPQAPQVPSVPKW